MASAPCSNAHLGVAEAVAAPGGLHMGAAVHALRLRQHALHALQVALYLLLPVHCRLLALHGAYSTPLKRWSTAGSWLTTQGIQYTTEEMVYCRLLAQHTGHTAHH